MTYECKYCKSKLSSKQCLNLHMKTTKYCLKIQGKEQPADFKCSGCDRILVTSMALSRHISRCVKYVSFTYDKKIEQIYANHQKEIDKYLISIKEQKKQISVLQDKLENIALRASTKPTTVNNTQNNELEI